MILTKHYRNQKLGKRSLAPSYCLKWCFWSPRCQKILRHALYFVFIRLWILSDKWIVVFFTNVVILSVYNEMRYCYWTINFIEITWLLKVLSSDILQKLIKLTLKLILKQNISILNYLTCYNNHYMFDNFMWLCL